MAVKHIKSWTMATLLIFVGVIFLSCGGEKKAVVESDGQSTSRTEAAAESKTAETSDAVVQSESADQARPGIGGGQGGDFLARAYATAAEALGISEEDLVEALGDPPDFEAAAKKLEIALEKLQKALPVQGGAGFGGLGDFQARFAEMYAEAAEKLELSVEDLVAALGIPPNFEAASEKLDITIEKLQEVLPLPQRGQGAGGGLRGGGQAN